MFRKILCACLSTLTLCLAGPVSGALASSAPSVSWEGKPFTESVIQQENNFYLGLGPVCQKLGYQLIRRTDGTVDMIDGTMKITLDPANNRIDENGHLVATYSQTPEGAFGAGCVESGSQICMERGLMEECFGLDISWDAKKNTISMSPLMENMLTVATVSENSETPELKIDVQYPQFTSLDYPAACAKINAVMKKAAGDAVAFGKSNAADLEGVDFGGETRQCETWFDYSIRYNRNGLLCVVLTDYEYSGGAHGSTGQIAHTFDLKTGKEYSFGDLMKDSSYLPGVNTSVRKQIDARKSDGVFEFPDDPFKTVSAKQDFYLSNRGVVVYFQQYDHFPYAAGIQEFVIDPAALRGKLKPQFSFLADQVHS